MALPLILPAASAIAKASGVALASGLTTKLLLDKIRSNYDTGNTEEIRNELMRRNNIGITSSQVKSVIPNIPLVLRPEYRAFSETEGNLVEIEPGVYGSASNTNETPSPKSDDEKPKNDDKPKDKKGFKKGLEKGWEHTKKVGSTIGTGLGYGIGFGVPVVGTGLGSYGLYKLFSSDEEDNNTNDEDGVSLKPMTWAK